MYRFAQEQLVRWKSSPRRKPLIVRGARQVGKTWLVERFADAEFDTLVVALRAPGRGWLQDR